MKRSKGKARHEEERHPALQGCHSVLCLGGIQLSRQALLPTVPVPAQCNRFYFPPW